MLQPLAVRRPLRQHPPQPQTSHLAPKLDSPSNASPEEAKNALGSPRTPSAPSRNRGSQSPATAPDTSAPSWRYPPDTAPMISHSGNSASLDRAAPHRRSAHNTTASICPP